MFGLERAGAAATGLLPLAVIAALVWRGRAHRCRLFPLYLASVSAFNLAVAIWPRLFEWSTWLVADMVQATLVLGVAAEITLRAFVNLPRGQQTARVALLACLVAAVALVWSAGLAPPSSWSDLARSLVPRLGTARAVAFLGLFAVALYHELPLDDLHDAIVRGLAIYSAAAAVGLAAMSAIGWHARAWVSALLTVGYILLLLYWTLVAWRREPEVAPAVARRLWPWRS